MQWIVQASSRSWSGDVDICMNQLNGQPCVFHTIDRILSSFKDSTVVVAAPEFDRDGSLPSVLEKLGPKVKIFFGHSESPLKRMLAAADSYFNEDGFLRVDGLNMFFNPAQMAELWSIARERQLDLVKFPDDYPAQFTADYYSVSALRRLEKILPKNSPLEIHPKYGLMQFDGFSFSYFEPQTPVDDGTLYAARQAFKDIYLCPRDNINEKRVVAGDTLNFHYELARPYLNATDRVLDIACGGGYGSHLLSSKAEYVIGADIDSECVDSARERFKDVKNMRFQREDVTHMSFDDEAFDLVTSFETIEHVDDKVFIEEVCRVLKPGGVLLLSTPQNSHGHIPVNPHHLVEYSLDQIETKVKTHFNLKKLLVLSRGVL